MIKIQFYLAIKKISFNIYNKIIKIYNQMIRNLH